MSNLAVLYDHPGPKAKRRNLIASIIFGLLLIGLAVWVWVILDGKGQVGAGSGERWKPLINADNWKTYLLPGLWNTIRAALVAVVISVVFGAIFGIARLSDHAWVRWIASVVVEFFRAIPVIILMVFAYTFWNQVFGTSNPFAAVVIGLVLYNGSVLAEVFRAGILSLPNGQTEASKAIGLRKTQMMMSVLLPQAITAMLPATVSQLVVIVKDTALGGLLIVGYTELRRVAGTSASYYRNLLPTYVLLCVIYLVLNLLLVWAASALEKRMRVGRKGRRTAAPKVDLRQDFGQNV
ncbi:amino acid ABC transporter permease [Nakamurella aerolata]|uniref:Amino acid ABC transporter permease n=1 Tax=Nakamurella aerolata TaxID=1656892 RepID=A0A849AAE6_9ACTN|nr:amino acid ABC transporter permease [Nakamurella aerolata]NNG36098.1 amino acid ABC transporter permease [Nakamurella aerolata]